MAIYVPVQERESGFYEIALPADTVTDDELWAQGWLTEEERFIETLIGWGRWEQAVGIRHAGGMEAIFFKTE